MSPFLHDFTKFEIQQFWAAYPVQTVCRMSVYLRTTNTHTQVTNCRSINGIEHAEVTALNSITERTIPLLKKRCPKEESTVFDLSIRINLFPCAACRKEIFKTVLRIQRIIPKVSIRFILFFSCLHREKVKRLGRWIFKFIAKGITVVVGPILLNTLAKPGKLSSREVENSFRSDVELLFQFYDLLEIVQSSIKKYLSFSYYASDIFTFVIYTREELKSISLKNPPFICIFPDSKYFLTELVPKVRSQKYKNNNNNNNKVQKYHRNKHQKYKGHNPRIMKLRRRNKKKKTEIFDQK